ncbi:MAG: ATP-grasp domain-containing protein [Paracoccaceae bacterium]|nr:ATP-grasp domain-containing protein [Paracoccaceae bacterium]
MRHAARQIDPAAKIIAGDFDPEAHARYVADEFWAMPTSQDDNLSALIDGCRKFGVRAVLPTRDGELSFWARHRASFSDADVSVIVSPPEAIDRCLDKFDFASWGLSNGYPVIPAVPPAEIEGDGPFVVKERTGAGSRGLGLNLDAAAARAHAATLDDPIVQPFVSGAEISIDAWLSGSGEVHGLVLRWRDRVVNGESQVTTTFGDPALEAQAEALLSGLGVSGPVVAQAIVTSEGLEVIEVNPRFGGASTASIAVGLDSLRWSLLEIASPDDHLPKFDRRDGEVRQVRIPQDLIIHDPDF